MVPLSKNTSAGTGRELQISPLRFAPVEMTKGKFVAEDGQCGRGFSSPWVAARSMIPLSKNTSVGVEIAALSG
jgi:hypothetical protein